MKLIGLLQHYGLTSRLLDITSNKYIATYFACCSDFDKSGYLYKLDTKSVKSCECERETVLRKIDIICNYEKIVDNDVIGYFKSQQKKQEIHKNTITDSVIVDFVNMRITPNNIRYERQEGKFILFGNTISKNGHLEDNLGQVEFFVDEIIPSDEKIDRLLQINKEGKNYVYLFPDDKISLEIESIYNKLKVYKQSNFSLCCDFFNNEIKRRIGQDIPIESEIIMKLLENQRNVNFIFKEGVDYFTATNNRRGWNELLQKLLE